MGIRWLLIECCEGLTTLKLSSSLQRMENLSTVFCSTLEKIKVDLGNEGREGPVPDNIRYSKFHNLLR